MDIKLQKKIFNKFKFFHPEKPPMQSLMCFGIEVGNGWFGIIWKLCTDIKKILKEQKEQKDIKYNFEVIQVKSKYGSLRFYCNWETEEISDKIEKAEEESFKICEDCGAPGKPNKVGWIITLCDKCRGKKGWMKKN